VGLLRLALGPVVWLHVQPLLDDVRARVSYDDRFWVPYASWLPKVPDAAWVVLVWAGVVAAVLMTIGLFSRVATVAAFVVVATNVLASETHFHHNRTFLAILLGGVALLHPGQAWSLDAWVRRRRGRPAEDDIALWPLYLLRAQVSLVYLASGTSKLLDRDWVGGLVLWDRVVRHQENLPSWSVDLMTSRWLFYGIGPAAVATELFIGVGLWFQRTRLAAVIVALTFHLSIEVAAKVEVFSYAAIAALLIWLPPRTKIAPCSPTRNSSGAVPPSPRSSPPPRTSPVSAS
jgi:uncharacterized membrane protein YphA (DoxX/SURF4 family)